MNSLIHQAKRLIKQIVEQSETLEVGETLIIQETVTGCKLSKLQKLTAWIDEEGNVVSPSNFILLGSRPLKAKEVKRIIQDEEFFEYQKD